MPDAVTANIYGIRESADEIGSSAPRGAFVRAVVLQTLNDPSLRDPAKDAEIIATLRNKELYLRAPRNSLICREIDERKGFVTNQDIVCFPFFSSHVMLPVKAGEQVWLYLELPNKPFWLSRISEPLHVEDANFTHGDRRINRTFKGDITGDAIDDGSGNFVDPRKLTFQNGNPFKPEIQTLLGGQDTFPKIITNSKESKNFIIEPVPRVTKRPGDLIIQGSNNTAIRLGTEMGWSADSSGRPPENNDKSQASTFVGGDHLTPGLGAIDIVVGRGRYFQDAGTERDAQKSKKTKANTAKNTTRPYIEETDIPGTFETDKNVSTQQDEVTKNDKGNFKSNPHEGDPDFLMDASRVYVSTKSEIDKMLGTGPKGVATAFENAITDQTGAAIAVKSDHIRIIARKSGADGSPDDITNENPPANGTIRIVKEGKPDDDLATITIEADGTIHISGKKIFIGRKSDDGGEGGGPGGGGSQPYVKYKQLEDLLKKILDEIQGFADALGQKFNTTATPGFGGPDPALIQAAIDCTTFSGKIPGIKSDIEKIKSERIFGE